MLKLLIIIIKRFFLKKVNNKKKTLNRKLQNRGFVVDPLVVATSRWGLLGLREIERERERAGFVRILGSCADSGGVS